MLFLLALLSSSHVQVLKGRFTSPSIRREVGSPATEVFLRYQNIWVKNVSQAASMCKSLLTSFHN